MNVLVTGGGTAAPIDDVRSITNTSTGRFSASITEACLRRGAFVTHVHAPSAELPFRRSARFDLDRPEEDLSREFDRLGALRREYVEARGNFHLIPIRPPTVDGYASALERVRASVTIDLIFLAMAVSDYEPEPVAGKIESSGEELTIRCRRSPKVIKLVREWWPRAYLVGFKLLSGSTPEALVRRAEQACAENRSDATIANDLTSVREGRHVVHLVRPGHAPETFGPSTTMADEMVERVIGLAAARR